MDPKMKQNPMDMMAQMAGGGQMGPQMPPDEANMPPWLKKPAPKKGKKTKKETSKAKKSPKKTKK